jgi:cytochrome c oxidase subunit 2
MMAPPAATYIFFDLEETARIETVTTPTRSWRAPGVRVIARTERRWVLIVAAILVVVMVVVVATGIAGEMHPASDVEFVDPATRHLRAEFVESDLGATIEPDGSATERLKAEQYDFVPGCVGVPADTPVKFQLASEDAADAFVLPDTNVNTMVVPRFVAEVRTKFAQAGYHAMPCQEFCSPGHRDMGVREIVVPKERFKAQRPLERTSCAPE